MRLCPTALAALAAVLCAPAGAQETVLLGRESECQYLVPSEENGGAALGDSWTGLLPPENWVQWQFGQLGIGYDGSGQGEYLNWIHWEILPEMRYVNASLFVRVPFEVREGQLETWRSLFLRVRFEDGFVMWLNGERVASFQAPPDGERDWQSRSTGVYPDIEAVKENFFDLSAHVGKLRAGENVLAIQGLNNVALSQDFLMAPELVASEEDPGQFRDAWYLRVVEAVRDDIVPSRLRLTFGVATGRAYRLEGSDDLLSWETEVPGRLVRPEDGMRLTLYEPVVRQFGKRYFRLVEEP